MNSKEFESTMDAFTELMLTQEHDEEYPEAELFKEFVHIVDVWMRESFRMGASGSGVPHVIEKLRSANNPLATATADAMQWSYRQGQGAR